MKYFIIILSLSFVIACDDKNSAKVTEVNKEASEKELPAVVASKQEKHYTAENVPEKMTVQEKKKRFRALLVPAVKKVYAELQNRYQNVKQAIESGEQAEKIESLKIEYKAESDQDLLKRLKPHPVSIVLAQAAMESAWATSRFFTQANNIFGVWSFDKNEPRIAAGEKRGNKTIWLKKYSSIEDAIRDYYRVLARGPAFDKFRDIRASSNDPFKMVKGLDKYSELGAKYGKELASVIRYNKFNQFD